MSKIYVIFSFDALGVAILGAASSLRDWHAETKKSDAIQISDSDRTCFPVGSV
jgi:hypothetical protein